MIWILTLICTYRMPAWLKVGRKFPLTKYPQSKMVGKCSSLTKMFNGTPTPRRFLILEVILWKALFNFNHFLLQKNSWATFLKIQALIGIRLIKMWILRNFWRPTTKKRCKNRLKKKLLMNKIERNLLISMKCWRVWTILIWVAWERLVRISRKIPSLKMTKIQNNQMNLKKIWKIEWTIKLLIIRILHLDKSSTLL